MRNYENIGKITTGPGNNDLTGVYLIILISKKILS